MIRHRACMALGTLLLVGSCALAAGQGVVGDIKVVGNEKIDERVILTEMWLKRGDPYSEEAVAKARRNIMNLRYFQSVKITPERDGAANAVNLTVQVVERITWGVVPIVSLDGDENEDNEYGLRADENCLMGLGKSVSFRGSVTEERTRFALSFDDPQVFYTHFTAGAGLTSISYDWEDTAEDEVLQGYAYGGYRPTAETDVALRLTVREDKYSDVVPPLVLPGQEQITKLGLSFDYSDVDYMIDSLRGIGVYVLVESGVEVFGADHDFTKASLSVSYNYRMPNKHWIRGVLAGGTGDDLPWQELFTVGGASTVRGYEPGYRAGDQFARLTLQYEAPVWYPAAFGFTGTMSLVAFVDTGDAWLENDDAEFITGAGLGIRGYVRQLQAFTFSFDVGYGFKEEEWQPHLTFGGSF